jgi:predicted small secreted protein
MWKKVLALLLAGVIVAVAGGCNTVRGIGKDIQRTGQAIQKSTR